MKRRDLGLVEMAPDLVKDVVANACRVAGEMLCPAHRRALPRREVRRAQVVVEADRRDLLARDAGRLTKRRVVRNSAGAAVDMARFEDGRFLDSAR